MKDTFCWRLTGAEGERARAPPKEREREELTGAEGRCPRRQALADSDPPNEPQHRTPQHEQDRGDHDAEAHHPQHRQRSHPSHVQLSHPRPLLAPHHHQLAPPPRLPPHCDLVKAPRPLQHSLRRQHHVVARPLILALRRSQLLLDVAAGLVVGHDVDEDGAAVDVLGEEGGGAEQDPEEAHEKEPVTQGWARVERGVVVPADVVGVEEGAELAEGGFPLVGEGDLGGLGGEVVAVLWVRVRNDVVILEVLADGVGLDVEISGAQGFCEARKEADSRPSGLWVAGGR